MRNELCVPADAVRVAGEDGAGVAPAVGDEVELTNVKGVVTRNEAGEVYVRPTEINGMPVADKGREEPAEDTEESIEAMVRNERGGMLVVLLGLWLLLGGGSAMAAQELQQANRLDVSPIPTNNVVVFANAASVVYTVEIDNFSGSDIYLFVFNRGTNAPAGSRPDAAVVKVSNGTTGGKNWGPTGAPFDSLCVAASTTPFTLTNAAAGLGYVSVTRRASK